MGTEKGGRHGKERGNVYLYEVQMSEEGNETEVMDEIIP